jgi:uncharacterized protein (TIGR03086 family)
MDDTQRDTAVDIDLLAGVLDKTGDLVAGVEPGQAGRPTPCPDYAVEDLVNHLVGWVQVFAAGSQGRTPDVDPTAVKAGDDPAAEFRAGAGDLVEGWRTHGADRTVRLTGGSEIPASMVFNMTLMEYFTHGWDLAVATGQDVPFTDEEAEATLAAAQATLPPEYRGAGQSFGEIVPVPDDAPAVDRAVAFLGRTPA